MMKEYWRTYGTAVLSLVGAVLAGLLLSSMRYPVTGYLVGQVVIGSVLLAGVITGIYFISRKRENLAWVLIGLGVVGWLTARVMKVHYMDTMPWMMTAAIGVGLAFLGIGTLLYKETYNR